MAKPASNTPLSRTQIPWLVIICGCVISAMTFGPRSAMGLFQLPMLEDRGWDRTTFGMAMAIQNLLWGFGQPVFGTIADRFGTWRILCLSGVIYAAGLILMANAESVSLLYLSGGVMVGLGIAAGSFSIVLSAFARHVPPQKRSLIFGIGTAAGSAGMFLYAPVTQAMITQLGWSDTLIWLGIVMLVIPLLAIPLTGNAQSEHTDNGFEQNAREALREAFGHRSFNLLICGFFVCGFQVAFVTAHFPAYLGDIGIDASYAVIALAAIGFFNVIGALASGFISQIMSKALFLALIYIARSIAVILFLLVPPSPVSVIAFSVAMGLLWLSTVPPTNALVTIMFGTRHLGMLGGMVFLSHQIGSFLGVWLGGYLYDQLGSYNPVWWLSVGLGLIAALVHIPIRERAVKRHIPMPANPIPAE